ncbi:hypothetical protein [Novosphingobium huizhouense]|nr:hypothetical protein [Novosphingobium huizhouense]
MTAPAWKPARCACGALHPTFSLDGTRGPWRCRACHDLAANPPVQEQLL